MFKRISFLYVWSLIVCLTLILAALPAVALAEGVEAEGAGGEASPPADDTSVVLSEDVILSAAKNLIAIATGELGDTVLRIPQGVPIADADLLAGVSVVDENGEATRTTVLRDARR